jgi:hypothetical protein
MHSGIGQQSAGTPGSGYSSPQILDRRIRRRAEQRDLESPYGALHAQTRSWLNQAEIEIGIFTRQRLDRRRIPNLATFQWEANAWNRRLNWARTEINLQFDRTAVHRKFGYKRRLFR